MDGKRFHRRLAVILCLMALLLTAFTWVLYDLQVVHGEYYRGASVRNQKRNA